MERSLLEIAHDCVHFIDEDGRLTDEIKCQEDAQDLLLMIVLAQVYPDPEMLETSMLN